MINNLKILYFGGNHIRIILTVILQQFNQVNDLSLVFVFDFGHATIYDLK